MYPDGEIDEIARLFGRTETAVRSKAKILRLRRIRSYERWTPEQLTKLREMYADVGTVKIVNVIGHTLSSVHQKARKLGLRKSAEFMASAEACRLRRGDNIGAAFRFRPGQTPANKGMRRPGWAPGRMASTQFKKGQRSRNYLPIGTIRTDSDGYLRRKIADGLGGFGGTKTWEFVHRRVWEDAHGPIPKGHRLWWKDRNHGNCALENLELLSDAEHMARTTIHNLPAELKDTIMLAGRVKRIIRRRTREEQAKRS
jgi:HNH endonuclease